MQTLPRFDRHPPDLPLSLELNPPEDINELPTWPEIVDACDPLSLDEPFEVYRLKERWASYPSGTLVVVSPTATYLQPTSTTGLRITLKGTGEEPYFTASGVGCRQCPLWQSRALIVEGMGPFNPKVMIVAEAPGGDEDISGMPFVGQSGQLLRSYLSEVGLNDQDYFMTNVVRCRPPSNRTPTRKEAKACSHWLEEEVQRVNPRSVLLLGATARENFNQAWVAPGVPIWQLAHPAALLRDKRKTANWLAGLRDFAQQIGVGAHAANLKSSQAADWEHARPDWQADVLAVDTETRSLEDDYRSEVVTVQVSDGRSAQLYRPVHHLAGQGRPLRVRELKGIREDCEGASAGVFPEVREIPTGGRLTYLSHHALPKLETHPRRAACSEHQSLAWSEWEDTLDLTGRRYIYHNVKYDLPRIGGDLWRLDTWEDTALIAYVLRYPRVGLKVLGPEVTGMYMEPIQSVIGSGKKQIGFDEALERDPTRAVAYALKDAVVTARMFPVLYAELAKSPTLLKYYKEIEKPCVPVVWDMEQNGALIDNAALSVLEGELRQQIEVQRSLAQMWAGDEDINPNSGRDLAKTILALGGKLTDRTKTGELSTDKSALLRVCHVESADELPACSDPLPNFIRAILGYKQFAKLLSTYIPAMRRQDDAGRIHTNFNQMVTDTSRFSSSGPNLQNIPSRSKIGKRFRQVIVARPGHVIVKADFSQLELRIYAHYTGEQVLRDAYTGDERDVHLLFAQQWGVERAIAKNGVFGLVYGVEARKLAATLGIPEERTREFIDSMRRTMPSIAGGWQEHISHILDQYGYVETLYGWRNYYPEHRSPSKSARKAALREAANLPIQGTAGGILKRLLVAYDAWRRDTGACDSLPILMVHDEIVFEVPAKHAAEFGYALARLAPEINPLSVNLVLSVEVGPNWGQTVALEKWINATN